MSRNGQQRPVIHPKLRGKLENWERSQAALATVSSHAQTDGNGGASEKETGNAKEPAGSLSKSSFFHENYETVARRSSFGESAKPKLIPTQQPEIIHSGHFMVSKIADESGGESDDDGQEDVKLLDESCSKEETEGQFKDDSIDVRNKHQSGGSNRSSSNCSITLRKPVNIDGSLSKLFKHMSLAYRGKITSPKWKQFSGLKLMLKDKIRLNNVIWRAWHIEYIRTQQRPMARISATPFEEEDHSESVSKEGKCWKRRLFATPLEEDHKEPQSVLLEGKYWKRRMATIVEEYKKWRMFFRPVRDAPLSEEDVFHVVDGAATQTWNGLDYEMASLLARVGKDAKGTSTRRSAIAGTVVPQDSASIDDDFFQMMDFSDTLFQSLNQPFAFPDPREIAQAAHNADIIQPGLIQLQPTLDDFVPDFTDFFPPENVMPPTPCDSAQDSPIQAQQQQRPQVQHQTRQALELQPMEQQQQQRQQLAQLLQPQHTFLSDNQMFVTQLPINANPSVSAPTDVIQLHSVTPTSVFPGDWLAAVAVNPPQQLQQPAAPVAPQHQMSSQIPQLTALKRNGGVSSLTFVSVADDNCNTLAVIEPSNNKLEVAPVVSPSSATATLIEPKSIIGGAPVSLQVKLQTQSTTTDSASGGESIDSKQESLRQLRQFQDTLSALSPASISYATGGSSQLLVNLLKSESAAAAVPVVAKPGRSGSGGYSTSTASITSPTSGRKARHKSAEASLVRSSSSYLTPLKSNLVATQRSSLFSMPEAPNSRSATSSIKSSHSNLKTSVLPAEASLSQQYHHAHHHPPPPSDGNRSSGIPKQNRLILPSPVVLPQFRNDHFSVYHQQLSPDTAAVSTSAQHSVIFSPAILSHTPTASSQQQISSLCQTPIRTNRLGSGVSRSAASTPSPGGTPLTPDLAVPRLGPAPSTTSPTSPPTSSSTPELSSRLKRDDDDDDDDDSVWVGPSFKKTKIDQNSFEEEEERTERRQKVHVSSEQKRRGNINSGFEMLQAMIPSVNSHLKVSKAQTLQKATEYMAKLKQERERRKMELANLRSEADSYGRAITEYQNALPATGVSFSYVNPNNGKAEQSKLLWKMYRDYVRSKTMDNWKFWVLSKLLTPLFDTYVAAVTGLKMERTEELVEALQNWMEMHCSLTALRPMIMNALRKLSTSTSIINRPDRLPQQAVEDVSED